METLLVVLVIGCALAFVVQIGRGMWARTRTVVRHQDALDTLAELTQRPDGAAAAEAPSDPSAFSERQAHVRLIGPVGRAPSTQTATALPPPAILPSSASPFRRAAGTMPSAAPYGAADAYYAGAEVTGPAGAGPAGAGPVVTGPEGTREQVSGPTIRSPFAPARYDGPGYAGHAYGMPDGGPQYRVPEYSAPEYRAPEYRAPEYRAPEYRAPEYGSPRHAGPGYPPPIDHTMPGLPPRPLPAGGPYATSFVEAPTAPVPIVQPQVFYFDDLSSRGEVPEGAWKKRRLLGRRRRNRASQPNGATGEHMLPAVPPTQVPFAPPPMTAPPMTAPPMPAPPMPAPPMPASVASNGQPTTGPGPLAVVTALPTADATMPPSAGLPSAGPRPGAAGPEEGKHTTRGRHRNDGGVKHAEGKDDSPKAEGKRKSVVSVVLAAAAICVAIVAIGATVLGLPGHANTPHAAPTTDTPPTTAPVHPTTTVAKQPTTTTSAPPPPKPAVLVSNQNGTATYQLRSRSASIVVSATGPCWYEVRANSPLGQIVNEGTLESGTRFSVTGPAWIRLGNPPAVAVKVDGTPMTVPGAGLGAPLNLQFTLG